MKRKGNLKKRCIYAATFEDGYAYIGLTWNTADRWQRHMSKGAERPSPIYLHSVVSNLQPNFEQLTDYMPESEAKKEEERFIREYGKKWILLNGSKGGELGTCSYKWTKKAVFERVARFAGREATQEPLRSRLCRYQGIPVQLQPSAEGRPSIGCGYEQYG